MPRLRIDLSDGSVIFCKADWIPPVGTTFPVHKHVAGESVTVKITAHEWALNEKNGDPDDKSDLPELQLTLKGRAVW
jgi:hypothetical protein